ncbi:MAG: hypothetical protein NTV94_18560, partial [Planctomycetota bacterium]|nr:hypothetical protein [Planctomycetota bacterium]
HSGGPKSPGLPYDPPRIKVRRQRRQTMRLLRFGRIGLAFVRFDDKSLYTRSKCRILQTTPIAAPTAVSIPTGGGDKMAREGQMAPEAPMDAAMAPAGSRGVPQAHSLELGTGRHRAKAGLLSPHQCESISRPTGLAAR